MQGEVSNGLSNKNHFIMEMEKDGYAYTQVGHFTQDEVSSGLAQQQPLHQRNGEEGAYIQVGHCTKGEVRNGLALYYLHQRNRKEVRIGLD
jgi:hypothetical protein